MAAKLKVTQVKSTISHIARNRATVRALGLHGIGSTSIVTDNPATRGMVRQVYSASRVMLKPASQGTGVIAGGSVRAVVEAAGIRDILAKTHGSTNPVNVTRATIEALRSLHSAEELGRRRGIRLVSRIGGQSAAANAPAEVADGR